MPFMARRSRKRRQSNSDDGIGQTIPSVGRLKTPFCRIRRMTAHLRSLGHSVNHKRIQRLMRKMGLEAVYRKLNTSLPNKEHTIYPYLLKDLMITRATQVWATDITARAAPQSSHRGGGPLYLKYLYPSPLFHSN